MKSIPVKEECKSLCEIVLCIELMSFDRLSYTLNLFVSSQYKIVIRNLIVYFFLKSQKTAVNIERQFFNISCSIKIFTAGNACLSTIPIGILLIGRLLGH